MVEMGNGGRYSWVRESGGDTKNTEKTRKRACTEKSKGERGGMSKDVAFRGVMDVAIYVCRSVSMLVVLRGQIRCTMKK